MKIVTDLDSFYADGPTAVTIGKYDGIHKGHQLPLSRILKKKEEGLLAVVFTFEPSPAVFFGWEDPGVLMSPFEKRRIFEKLGVDILVEYPFNEKTAGVDAAVFIEKYLCEHLRCAYIAAGEDVSFGSRGAGNARMLRSYDKTRFETDIIEKITLGGEEISSSRIKKELMAGNIEMVNELIGFPYCITGEVVHGAHLGRELGMPTINLVSIREKLLPPCGVYYSYVSCEGKHFNSISNIGFKPTVSDKRLCGVETYMYDFSGDVYGKTVSVNLLSFRRPEMKFDSVEQLKKQMQIDIEAGKEFHCSNNSSYRR